MKFEIRRAFMALFGCRFWGHYLALIGVLMVSWPAFAQPTPAERAKILQDLLGSVYPSVTGSRELFEKLNTDAQLRAEVLQAISANPDLRDRAQEGLEYRKDYVKRMTEDMVGDGKKLMLSPIDSAIDSLSRFESAHFETQYQTPPEWKILRDSWEETLNRFALDRSMTPADLERKRRESELYERAFEFYMALKRRMEYWETPEVVGVPKADVFRWKRYFQHQIHLTREQNLRQALAASVVYSNPTFVTDVYGKEETQEAYKNMSVFQIFELLGDTLRLRLKAEDFRQADIYLIRGNDSSPDDIVEQGVYLPKRRTLYNMVRALGRSFYTINRYFRIRFKNLPKQAMKSAEQPVKREDSRAGLLPSEDYVIVAFNPKTLSPAAQSMLKDQGYTLKFKTSDFAKTVLDGLFTDSVLHYESSHAKEKRFVSEASLRDLQMGDLQRVLEQDESEEVRPLLRTLQERKESIHTVSADADFPVTLMDQARTDYKLGTAKQEDLVTGLNWWGQSIFPAYWTVRDAVAKKHKRPHFEQVFEGKASPKKDIYPRPFSRLASHFRTGSKAKRAMITAGVLAVVYSMPLWFEPSRNAVGEQLRNIMEAVQSVTSQLPKPPELPFELPNLGLGSGSGAESTKPPSKPKFGKYDEPYIVPEGQAGKNGMPLFQVVPGPKGFTDKPYFYSFADSFETHAGPYEVQNAGYDSPTTNDPFARRVRLPGPKEANYYLESFFTYTSEEFDGQRYFPVPLAPNHTVVSFEIYDDYYRDWIQGYSRAYIVNGFAFIPTEELSYRGTRIRVGYANGSQPAVPSIDKPLNKAALLKAAQVLRGAGFTNLSEGVQSQSQKNEVQFSQLEGEFSMRTNYVYEMVGSKFGDPNNPFYGMTQFLKGGVYHAQCTGSFEMFRTFADQYKKFAGDNSFNVQPYVGYSVNPADPMLITSGTGHITARFVQVQDGAAKVFDATGSDRRGQNVSKADDPWKSPLRNPEPSKPEDQPWNRRRREIWLGLVADARNAIDDLRRYQYEEASYANQVRLLEAQLEQLRAAIVEAKPSDNEHLQSPSSRMLDVLPDLTAYRAKEITFEALRERLLRKLSPFVSMNVKTDSVKSILNDFYDMSRKYFAQLNDWADNDPRKVYGLDALLNDKLQTATLNFASSLYYTTWTPLEYVPKHRTCEDLLIRNDSEDWSYWDKEMRRVK